MEYLGNVVRICDAHTLVINAGKEYDLNVGDKIQVYEITDEITDIDGSKIDDYYFIKAPLTITRCEEHYSICVANSYLSPAVSEAIAKFATSPLLSNVSRKEELDVSKDDFKPLKRGDSRIHVGDFVKLA